MAERREESRRAAEVEFSSDYGAPCPVCGGTVVRYTVPVDLLDGLTGRQTTTVLVRTFCYSCHRADGFWAEFGWNTSASEVRRVHRQACGMDGRA